MPPQRVVGSNRPSCQTRALCKQSHEWCSLSFATPARRLTSRFRRARLHARRLQPVVRQHFERSSHCFGRSDFSIIPVPCVERGFNMRYHMHQPHATPPNSHMTNTKRMKPIPRPKSPNCHTVASQDNPPKATAPKTIELCLFCSQLPNLASG